MQRNLVDSSVCGQGVNGATQSSVWWSVLCECAELEKVNKWSSLCIVNAEPLSKLFSLATSSSSMCLFQPKPVPVLGAVNKPLTVPGRRPYTKTTPTETGNNNSTNTPPTTPASNKSRYIQDFHQELGFSSPHLLSLCLFMNIWLKNLRIFVGLHPLCDVSLC